MSVPTASHPAARGLLLRAGQWIDQHFMTLCAALGALVFTVGLPHLRGLLFELPSPADAGWPLVVGFYAFTAGLVALDVALLAFVVPRAGASSRPARWVGQVLEVPLRQLARLPAAARRVVGAVLTAAGATVFVLDVRDEGPVTATALVLLLGLLLACSPRAPLRSPVAVAWWRGWTALLLTTAIGALLWWAVPRWPDLLSYRNFTGWAALELGFLALLAGRLLDATHRFSRNRLRLIAVAVVVTWILLERPVTVGAPSSDEPVTDAAWLRELNARLDELPPGPAVVVAASGGGARAALFAALVLDGLARASVFPDGTAPANGDRSLADQVLLISSVSGGSLASAWFATRQPQPDRAALRHTIEGELAAHTARQAARFRSSPFGRSGPFATALFDELAARCDDLRRVLDGERPRQPPLVPLRSAYPDDMSADFMAPVLRGMLQPGVDRAQSLVAFWREQFAWEGVDNRGPRTPGRPLLALNAACVQRGCRLAIGFPPLPPRALDDRVLTLSQLDPGYRLGLAEAVRLSAGFPWLMPVARLDVPMPDPTAAPLDDEVHVIDGGIVDNTGIDTLAALLRALHELAWGEPEPPVTGAARALARLLVKRLRRRGVIFVEIDSGMKKRALGPTAALLTHFEPVEALALAAERQGAGPRAERIRAMQQLLPSMPLYDVFLDFEPDAGHEASPPEFTGESALVHVTLSCDLFDDVMTAWALGPEDKAVVWTTFLFEFGVALPSLRETFWALWQLDFIRRHAADASAAEFEQARPIPAGGVVMDRLRDRVAANAAYREALRRSVSERRPGRAAPLAPPPAAEPPTLRLCAAAPAPQTGEEALWLQNPGRLPRSLRGWQVRFGEHSWPLDDGDGVAWPGAELRLLRRGRAALPDHGADLELVDPQGDVVDAAFYRVILARDRVELQRR